MNTNPASLSMRLKTRRVLAGWKRKHSRSRLVRALAALLLVSALSVGTSGCVFSQCGPCMHVGC